MTLADIGRRLARLEAARHTGAPTAILSDHPTGDTAGDLRAADALANWQRWIAQGKATISNGVLCLVGPEMTADEWAARFVTEPEPSGMHCFRAVTSNASPLRSAAHLRSCA